MAAGAGGHAGTLSPFALIQEIRQWFDGPVFLSGAIATGDAVLYQFERAHHLVGLKLVLLGPQP